MEIYFAGSIRAGRQDVGTYAALVGHLKNYGRVLTEHVGDPNLTSSGEADAVFVFERDMNWMDKAEVMVAEVSTPSLGVGYEIARAEQRRLPILCLYRRGSERKLSNMIAGNGKLVVREYSETGEALARVDEFFKSIKDRMRIM